MASAAGDNGGEIPNLYWDSTYAIVQAIMDYHPSSNPVDIGLEELAALVIALPGFSDDPALVNERILLDIQSTWYEEASL
jgi:FeS assembly protein IscX